MTARMPAMQMPSLFDCAVAAVRAVKSAAADILNSSSGFGHVDFAVDVAGDLVPQSTTITHAPNKGEPIEAFITRLRTTKQWQHGDAVQFVYNKGEVHLVRVTRNPPRIEAP